MKIVSPEPDTYGQYSRASMLADYVELLALKGDDVKQSVVADFLADSDWNLELIEEPTQSGSSAKRPTSLSERRDDADSMAAVVFEQFDERQDTLRQHYPFKVSARGVSVKEGVNVEESAYVALLTITIAQAFGVQSTSHLAPLFERAVTRVMERRGLWSVCFAETRRRAKSFTDALERACPMIGLRANPGGAPTFVFAQDEKVDVICHLGWERGVLRPGSWVMIGQATVGRSDSWLTKIKEPAPMTWAFLVDSTIWPLRFLAVPHHVERRMMRKLTFDGNGLVMDRLRLVNFKADVDGDERATIRAVTGATVEPLVG